MAKKVKAKVCDICGGTNENSEEIVHKNVSSSMTTDYIVRKTRNYDKFSYYSENRDIDPQKVMRYYIKLIHGENFPPIMVSAIDENFRELCTHKVGDGQHRIEAYKKAKMEIPYMIYHNMTTDVIPILNNIEPFKTPDYLKLYKDKKEPYKFYDSIIEKYGKGKNHFFISHEPLLIIMGGSNGRITPNEYKYGKLMLSNQEEAEEIIEKLIEYQKEIIRLSLETNISISPSYINDRLVKGLLKFMRFNHEENMKYMDILIKKLNIYLTKNILTTHTSIPEYTEDCKKIFDYKEALEKA